MNVVLSIKHRLYSFPHFANVSPSALVGIERIFPIKASLALEEDAAIDIGHCST